MPFTPNSDMSNVGFSMAGTERTFRYRVLAITPAGRVGIRDLGDGQTRVRVEPSGSTLEPLEGLTGWKQPGDGDQHRYSTVVADQVSLTRAVNLGLSALSPTLVP